MSWLARLKTAKVPEKDASKTTKSLSVVSVALTPASFQKNKVTTAASNDPASAPAPMAETVDIGTAQPPSVSPQQVSTLLAQDASIIAAGTLPGNGSVADWWPHSTAKHGAEIDLFMARLHRFTNKGLTSTDGEAWAHKLVNRDRETDDRRSCLECMHLSVNGFQFPFKSGVGSLPVASTC